MYDNGMQNAPSASQLAYLVKFGIIQLTERGRVDDSLPNAWTHFVDNAAGTGKIPYFVAADANNQTFLANPNGVAAWDLSIQQLATPATPTITTSGTAGATTDAYKIVARNGRGASLGSTPASAAGSVTTANATLTAANFNIITFAKVDGAAFYDIYRTTAGGTPSTTGLIGTVTATRNNAGVQPATYTFNDTGLAGDGSTAPTVNSTGVASFPALLGDLSLVPLTTPVAVVVTPVGTAGATSYSYKIVAKSTVGTTAASTAGSTTTGNATLSTTNLNRLTWDPVPGAVSYDVYRTVGAATQGKIANVASSLTTLDDTGLAGDSTTAPTVNTTGTVGTSGSAITGATTGAVLAVSTNTITPTNNIHHVGAGLIKTITVPAGFGAGGVLQIIPDAAFTYDATGNIVVPAGGGTATVNKLMTFVWDTAKWTPSY